MEGRNRGRTAAPSGTEQCSVTEGVTVRFTNCGWIVLANLKEWAIFS